MRNIESADFIFTESGFTIESDNIVGSGKSMEPGDKWETAYNLAFLDEIKLTVSAQYMQRVALEYARCLSRTPGIELERENAHPLIDDDIFESLIDATPFCIGSEYISREWLEKVFDGLGQVFSREIQSYDGTVSFYFSEKSQHLHVPEKVFFHLVENKDEKFPFAFLATYAAKQSDGSVSHVPLKYAMTEYSGRRNELLSLLSCLNKAAKVSDLIRSFMESGELMHPLRLNTDEAWQFLKDVEVIEENGILCRIPNWWRKKAVRPSLSFSAGDKDTSLLGFDSILTLVPKVIVDGVELDKEDIEKLLLQAEGLTMIKGKWVEVNHEKLRKLLEDVQKGEREITLGEVMQSNLKESAGAEMDIGGKITNGKWLSSIFAKMRSPGNLEDISFQGTLYADLRPYQKTGYNWLKTLDSLGFGACIADDMGLGKTIQVLTYLEDMRASRPGSHALVIVPASLLGNWKKEIERFTPYMDFNIIHASAGKSLKNIKEDKNEDKNEGTDKFLQITTYGMVGKLDILKERNWDTIILDEAQAIKNPSTKQTKNIKELKGRMRIIMTGTPIENDLTNLWSLYDFADKGLLGSFSEFKGFVKGLNSRPEGYSRLRNMISPFMLRRVKTDKRILADLPEKIEILDYAALSRKQAILYRKAVTDMEESVLALNPEEKFKRSGIVLSTLMHLKQICNHPDQYLGENQFSEKDSGKMQILREICETIRDKHERVIVFTQFREMTKPLSDFLTGVFGHPGLVLHGGTPVKKRGELVEKFQGEAYVPYFVISVKAGGTGLNLTAANHVIHFDRWWNPAVENQATDRAFRIGQKKDVIVHKLVCEGTIEEKIDAVIESKKELVENVIGKGSNAEKWITQLSNEELSELLRLD